MTKTLHTRYKLKTPPAMPSRIRLHYDFRRKLNLEDRDELDALIVHRHSKGFNARLKARFPLHPWGHMDRNYEKE